MPENTCFSRLLMLTDAVHQLRSKIAPKRRLFEHLTPLATKESLNSGITLLAPMVNAYLAA
jgi:hypothetical protein